MGVFMGETVNGLVAFNYVLGDGCVLQAHTRLRWDAWGPGFPWVTTRYGSKGKT